jgi:sarcosine oxidase subunit alpha
VIREAFAGAEGRIAALTVQPQAGGGLTRLTCDVLAVSVGRIPSWRLPLQAGGKLTVQGEGRDFAIGNLPEGVHLCGAVSGRGTLAAAMADGAHAGLAAAARLGFGAAPAVSAPAPTARPIPDSFIQPHPKGRDFVDLDEDLQTKDLLGAVADGYSELELVKRFSTVGMGPTQGRHSAFPTAQIVAEATGRRLAQVGVTTARPPVVPVALEALAGRAFDPERLSPMDALHRAAGAQMMPTGAWWRPAYYGDPKDRAASIAAEVRAIRTDIGIIDVATLGKLELRGPDSAAFLERFYTGKFSTQKVGKIRYLLALADTGAIIDDGVALKLADDLFYLTTTTGAADRIYRSMLWWNAQWRMDIDIASFTSANASLNLAGPRARELMAGLSPSFAIDAASLPYMSGVEGTLDGVPAKVMRIGFVGELGYEIHVPAGYGAWLWRRLAEAGARPVGTEAQRVLRLEKGHIIVGQDTDAVCDPEEAAMMWAVGKNKGDFIGAR